METHLSDYQYDNLGIHSVVQEPLMPRPSRPFDFKATDCQKLHVLVAANCERDVSKAEALLVRFFGHSKVECRAICDDPTAKAVRFAPTLENSPSNIGRGLNNGEGTAHVWAEWADLLVLAPISADTLGKMLNGITGTLILDVLRGWDVSKKIILVPGMTTSMWENPMTKKQLSKLRRKWNWVRVMPPILWQYDEKGAKKCLIEYDGFPDLVETINNQAELLTIGHDVDITTSGDIEQARRNQKTETRLPSELWTIIFDYVGDWEVAQSIGIYTNLPIPKEWELRESPKDELHEYMRSLESTILTKPVPHVIGKLDEAPKTMEYLSSLCVKLIIKFCLTDVLSYLETKFREVFWTSFGGKLLPTKASAVYGRNEILEWWRTSASFLKKDYTDEAIDGASKSGFVHVLDWWKKSGLPLKYSEAALEQASSKGHILVLEWWKEASMHQGAYILEPEAKNPSARRTNSSYLYEPASPSFDSQSMDVGLAPLRLKVGKSVLCAAQNGQTRVVHWWDTSGIPYSHSDSVARVASTYGHVDVLETWKSLKGSKFAMSYDNQVLVGPTKNGFVRVLEWWRRQTSGEHWGWEGKRLKVEYKTCDIEEALEDSVRLAGGEGEDEVRKWWARNGLNLGVGTSEWMEVKTL
ncbi:hypothetical protein V495_03150 [Pseudogymnoascus sp. VKM F-4514 (FW-929)]|nr:hypothetical protein V495_03150 [Pseudogymnoascus sp. VKM F-4514 (FW-929)]KFY59009.1 hypothetical protein V497_04553 [Pseudogymnoascus sp. VKM F-4516 (FW-969)]